MIKVTNYLAFVLIIGLVFGKNSRKISGYDNSTNSFFCTDTSQSNISVLSFIKILEDASGTKQIKNRKLRKCISKYVKALNKTNEMAILYQKGSANEDGRVIIEDLNLIKNVKYWYYVGGALSTIIIAPYIIELIILVIFSEDENEEYNQYDSPDYENGNNYKEYFKERITKLGKKTFLPGLAIISIGYIGQNIKIGQKKNLIRKSDIAYPTISKFFSPDELKKAIEIYNNL